MNAPTSTEPQEAERAVDIAAIAELLNISAGTVYRMAQTSEIPGFKVGTRWRFFPSRVVDALSAPTDAWAAPTRGKKRRA
ncbi:helix-turn-helix domain-containing protein [Agromyces atrinae]|uniref:helix-turn-helix domain-containing protein n=1 Tax=Agromyces atrinae TaxID=592376 RepID=UPI001F57F8E4|nr:helix-turn-helix domain-containing protein [Agromyces atrinae]MCI2958185.1 helix-turn-helix domain-containing protein [Agromyces atrinae]